MKKIYKVCIALLFVIVIALTGCMPSKSEVFDYLKSNGKFQENFAERNKYTLEFSVENDLSYSLTIHDTDREELRDYTATGKLNYLGSYKTNGSYESWGLTRNYKIYYYIIKLDGATTHLNFTGEEKEYNFYLIMSTFSDRIDFSDPNIVYHVADGLEKENIQGINVDGFRLSSKNK